ncbi:MAG TPA: DUF3592 domain-containing protein [Herpetosiphonaceae bacterium]|nr:DUF3592 domain-containing protein [Herpetosiphonaceae bacterium]
MRRSSPVGLRIAALVVSLSCLVLLVLAAVFAYPSVRLLREADRASGNVVSLASSGSSSSRTRRAVVEYAVGDDIYTVTSSVSSSPPAFAVGEKVTVLYDPADPADGTIESFLELWFVPMLLGILGAVDGVVMLVLWALVWRRR